MKVYYKQVQLNPTTAVEYPGLLDKPQINSVELLGNQDTEQIKVTWFGTQAEFDALGTYSPTTIYIIDDGIPAGQQNSYLDLSNKPMINGQVLTGNKQSSDLNIYNMDEVDNMLASLRSIKVVSAIPSAPLANTMYYVGPDSEGIYLVYLYDSLLNRIDLGESVQRLYEPGDAIRIDEGNNKIHVRYDDRTLEINSEGELAVIAADNTTAYMNGHLLDSESTSVNTDIIWRGTQAQYDAITTKNPNTVYFIEDGNAFLDCLYPIGSIYMSMTMSTASQVSAALGGGWTRLADGYFLQSASSGAGTTVAPGLPNITGSLVSRQWALLGNETSATTKNGALSCSGSGSTGNGQSSTSYPTTITFNAQSSNPIYGASTTVQPPAIKCYMYQRVS